MRLPSRIADIKNLEDTEDITQEVFIIICILLFYYGQLTVMDIAAALETNENTIKTRLSMARAKIRAALEEKAEKEGIKLWGSPLACCGHGDITVTADSVTGQQKTVITRCLF